MLTTYRFRIKLNFSCGEHFPKKYSIWWYLNGLTHPHRSPYNEQPPIESDTYTYQRTGKNNNQTFTMKVFGIVENCDLNLEFVFFFGEK